MSSPHASPSLYFHSLMPAELLKQNPEVSKVHVKVKFILNANLPPRILAFPFFLAYVYVCVCLQITDTLYFSTSVVTIFLIVLKNILSRIFGCFWL